MSPRREPQQMKDEAVLVEAVAKFEIGDVVHHRMYPFRGVVFGVDPTFNHSEDWWLSIPERVRPKKEQPYYHVLAENEDATYVAYVSEGNLVVDETGRPCRHPDVRKHFVEFRDGRYVPHAAFFN